jgi:hypothetical protein
MCGNDFRIGNRAYATSDTRNQGDSSTKKCSLPAAHNHRARALTAAFHGASGGAKTTAFSALGLLKAKLNHRTDEVSKIRIIKSETGSTVFWAMLFVLLSSALALVGMLQILKSQHSLQYMQQTFRCAHEQNALIHRKWRRIQALTKSIATTRKLELAAKAIPTPASQQAAKVLEATRLLQEKWQDGEIIMAQGIFIKHQISSCRKIERMVGQSLNQKSKLGPQKVARDPIYRTPLLKMKWSVCLEHKGHQLWLSHQQQNPKLKIRSTYGIPCATLLATFS